MDWTTLVPAIIGAFVGVMGWLIVGLYIQRRQFHRQARNAAKAVYFELDVNLATISVARDHGLFSDLDRSSFERLLAGACDASLGERPEGGRRCIHGPRRLQAARVAR